MADRLRDRSGIFWPRHRPMRITLRRAQRPADPPSAEHLDALLDAALADSFPASDPVAIGHAEPPAPEFQDRWGRRERLPPTPARPHVPTAPSTR